MLHAMAAHPPGRRGLTIGTLTPWLEAIALHSGAANITIAEYQPILSSLPAIRSVALHPRASLGKRFGGGGGWTRFWGAEAPKSQI